MFDRQELIKKLSIKTDSKIVLLVMDGVGGLPDETGGSALDRAHKPNLDNLAKKSELGLSIPVALGITPGSGPAHLSLFGYDPLKYDIGRGILEALGIDVNVEKRDLVARGNFATIEGNIVKDRRAGRPATEVTIKACEYLSKRIKSMKGVDIHFYPGKEHRFVLKLTGDGLDDRLTDADPQKEGSPIRYTEPLTKESERTAEIVNTLLDEIKETLKDYHPMNFALLRGFSKYPVLPQMQDVYKLAPAAIASYPMYRGLAKLVGMNVLKVGMTVKDEFDLLEKEFKNYDFFYIHIKKTDSYGEDGNIQNKVRVIEEVDAQIPRLLSLNPDVIVVTGDHSTPAVLKGHSWHPNPFLLYSKCGREDEGRAFNENECVKGTLGMFYAVDAMSLMMAYALKLKKYGA